MPRILSVATASPPYILDAATTKEWCRRLYEGRRELPALLRVIDHSGVSRRHLALPPERLIRPRPFSEKNAEYLECALPLAEQAARRALDRAGLPADRIDLIVTTSCTGLLIPSLSARLAPRLGLRADVVRLPITELGCAAGAAALARAADYVRAWPGRRALVLACELPSVTFQIGDLSMTNFVSAAIFGDGAAAAVVGDADEAGAAPRRAGPELVRSRSHLYPDSLRLMGFDIAEGGLHIVLARDVPEQLVGQVRPVVAALCEETGVRPEALRFAAIHPGGRRILENLEAELPLPPGAIEPSWWVLDQHGNMSSATVLFVLERVLARAASEAPPDGAWGLLAAFGPGFAAEMSLLRWQAR